jgi:TatD DNase family protein
MSTFLVDSHCHLADDAFQGDLAAVTERARAAGIGAAVCILSADEPEEVARAGQVSEAWPAVRFSTGVHPHRAGAYAGAAAGAAAAAERAVTAVTAVAVGEIGLDYHYDFAPRDVQHGVFASQIELAGRLGLPVVIHTREAFDDTVAILEAAMPRVRGVMHCFSGTRDEARRALDLGFYISLSGILTFPKAGSLREVAAFVPEDRLLIETDAPYLAPVPHRGKRNEPALVTETFAVLAAARGMDRERLSEKLAANSVALFGRIVDTPAKPMV